MGVVICSPDVRPEPVVSIRRRFWLPPIALASEICDDRQMKESDYQYASLDEALRDRRIPLENHNLIRALAQAAGIHAYTAMTGYLRAERKAGGPALRIASGWSNGFTSADEILAADSTAVPWESPDRPGLWGVDHPVHGAGSGGGGAKTATDIDYGTCGVCFQRFTVTGACGCL